MPVQISGSGSIAGVTSQDGLAIAGPCFSAYQTTATTLTQSVFGRVDFQVEDFDLGGRFNNTGATVNGIPPMAFMPNVPGYYLVTAGLQLSADANAVFLSAFKNGGEHRRGYGSGAAVNCARNPCLSVLVYLNGTTDYVDIRVYVGSATGLATQGGSLAYTNFFQAHMVRAA
jgi:hypothetical protein